MTSLTQHPLATEKIPKDLTAVSSACHFDHMERKGNDEEWKCDIDAVYKFDYKDNTQVSHFQGTIDYKEITMEPNTDEAFAAGMKMVEADEHGPKPDGTSVMVSPFPISASPELQSEETDYEEASLDEENEATELDEVENEEVVKGEYKKGTNVLVLHEGKGKKGVFNGLAKDVD